MEVAAKSLQKKVSLNLPQIVRIARTILRHERIRQGSLSIVFVTNPKIKNLNRKYLRRNYVTDVLAFDLKEGKMNGIMGDIIISTDAAIHNGRAYKTSTGKEIVLYLIHGILHLLGFDDQGVGDIKRIRKKEQELLHYFGTKINTVIYTYDQ